MSGEHGGNGAGGAGGGGGGGAGGADDDGEDGNIFTAAGDGQLAVVQRLVAGGVSVNAQDSFGYSPLHAAVSYRNADVAAWLLAQGARVDLVDQDGDTALMACEDPACADMLLAAGADLFHANAAGASALHVAVWECRDEMEQWLRAQYAARGIAPPEVGANPEDEDDDGGVDVGDVGEGDEGEGEGMDGAKADD